jgi:hypothetical protein
VQGGHARPLDGMPLPRSTGAKEPQALAGCATRQQRKDIEVVIAGHSDDLDASICEPPQTALEWTNRLEVAVLAIDDITADGDNIDLLAQRGIDNSAPGGGRRELVGVQMARQRIRQAAGTPADVNVASTEDAHREAFRCQKRGEPIPAGIRAEMRA